MRNSIIVKTGSFAPSRVIPNSYFNELLGEDVDTWLQENLTIKERRWCEPGQSTADLCFESAKDVLDNSGILPDQINLIIVATDTPEYISPSTASVVQYRLGARASGTFDINTACAGFVTALETGSKFIKSDENYENVLVIGAYAMSKYLDLTDKKTVTLFADGAGAVLLKSSNDSSIGYLASSLYTDGQYHDWMGIYAGGTHKPFSQKLLEEKDHLLKFVKKIPKEINPQVWTRLIKETCQKANISHQQIDHFLFTQININSIWETLGLLDVDRKKAHTIMDRYAYTGSACIPMALDDAWKKGKVKKGNLILFMGSGGGLAFACTIFKI